MINLEQVMTRIEQDYTLAASDYVEKMMENEKVIEYSQLRKLYALVADLNDKKPEPKKTKDILRVAKIKMIYQQGRDLNDKERLGVNLLDSCTGIIRLIDKIIATSDNELNHKLDLYLNYFQAIIAFYKFNNGKKGDRR